MPLNLATLAEKTVALSIPFGDEIIQAEYRPYKMTPKFRALLIQLDKGIGEDQRTAVAEMLSQMLASWDVVNNGEPYAPTYDNLIEVPIELLSAAADAVWADLGKRMKTETDA